MGILNLTPDSFSDGGQLFSGDRPSVSLALGKVRKMIEEGVDIIDVGGESTRPGASPVSLAEEQARVIPLLSAIRSESSIPVSVDTSRPEIIYQSAAAGASMINDVRALRVEGALQAAAETGLPVCLMHMQGEPGGMQDKPCYDDVVEDVRRFLLERVDACLAAGIDERAIVIDPGFGFGKTVQHNLALLAGLQAFVDTGFPVLVGLSRKSLLATLTGRNVESRLAGSLALALEALSRGASIVRVHDVGETVDTLKVHLAVSKGIKTHE